MASTDALWTDYTSGQATKATQIAKKSTGSNMDKEAFLKLLTTQLKYQDPLKPTEDTQFVAQMAQFASLEQMQNMSLSTAQYRAQAMIGSEVEAITFNDETKSYTYVNGVVESVSTIAGKVYLRVDGQDVPIDDVEKVASSVQNNMMNSINQNQVTSQAMSLIGKTIQALTIGADYEVTGFTEGKVDYVKFVNSSPVLVVGDKEIYPHEVISVAQENMIVGGMPVTAMLYNPETKEYREVKGSISDIIVRDGTAYAIINGETAQIDKINYLTEAIRRVGTNMTFGEVSGEVEDVVIKNGITYLKIGDNYLEYSLIVPSAKEEAGEGQES